VIESGGRRSGRFRERRKKEELFLVFEERAEIIVGDRFDRRKCIRNEYLKGLDI
jgi:hypothetical protein